MARNLLTDKEFRNAKPDVKDYRLRDGDGLFVLVAKTGGKSFQYRYKLNGKGQTATLKEAETLAEAREEVDHLRKLVAAGDHPKVVKQVARAAKVAANAQTFKAIADQWVKSETRRKRWSADYVDEVEQSLRNHLSDLDNLPVSRIVASITAPILHAVEINAPAMEEKVSRRLHSIMDYAVELGALVLNPLPRRRRTRQDRKHYPAITDLTDIGDVLRAARASDPCKGIQRAHLLLAFTGQRVSEVTGAKWDEFALDGVDIPIGDTQRTKRDPASGNWSIARERMKRKDPERGPHVVPLPLQLVTLLRQWKEADDGATVYVCPAPRDPKRPITPEAVEKHYRDALGLGGRHSPHSWRSAFSTICREAGKSGDVVEAQLDHVVGSKVASAYDRAQRLSLRRELMQWYEATLIAARDGADVVPMRAEIVMALHAADVPPWFDVARYADAYQMDAADWYLNLSLRGAIARGKCDFGRQYVRGPEPIVRRAGESPFEVEILCDELGGDFATLLDGKQPRAGIEYLSTQELYFFERRLPEAIREFGRNHVPGKRPTSTVPTGYVAPVDSLFEPRFLSAFVRIDLSLPDKTLIADLQAFLARERRALEAIGGTQPFAVAIRKLGNCKQANLDSFANYGVLPFLDVEQWRIDAGAKLHDAAFARLLGIEADALREAKKKAELVLDDFVLRGWLLDAARVAVRKPHP